MRNLYLDVCTICRPFDNQDYIRIKLETDSYYLILSKILQNEYKMIVSPVHFNEINAIKDIEERLQLLNLITKSGTVPEFSLEIARNRTNELIKLKFGIADAAHISFAEQKADSFITCDDKLINLCNRNKIKIKVFNPIEFCISEELQ